MKITILGLASLVVFPLLSSCNDGGLGASAASAAAANAPGTTPLTANAWCSNYTDENGANPAQDRLRFRPDGTTSFVTYPIKPDHSRGNPSPDLRGTYTLASNVLTVTIEGQSQRFTIRIDPSSSTGAAKLHMTEEGASEEIVYDPCQD